MLRILGRLPLVGCPACNKSLSWNDLVPTSDGYTVCCRHCGFTRYTLNGKSASRQALLLVGRECVTASYEGWRAVLNELVRFGGGNPNLPG
jgi:hypothetical protein